MQQDYDLIIVGGGLAGNCLALKLANSPLSAQERHDFEAELVAGLTSYTYLEK